MLPAPVAAGGETDADAGKAAEGACGAGGTKTGALKGAGLVAGGWVAPPPGAADGVAERDGAGTAFCACNMPLADINRAQAAIKIIVLDIGTGASVTASMHQRLGKRPRFVMRVGCAMLLAYCDDGLCALPAANDVEQIGKSALQFKLYRSYAIKAKPRTNPAAVATEVERSSQCAQHQSRCCPTAQQYLVTAHGSNG